MAIDRVLGERARRMRREPTAPEARLWSRLSRSQLDGLKFRRQASIDGRIVDFFCPAIGLAIEIDGDTHDRETDARRDARFRFAVIRFTNADVMSNLDGVLEAIGLRARQLPARWPKGRPHPNPSPEGEGLSI